jgi:hypothetical protein
VRGNAVVAPKFVENASPSIIGADLSKNFGVDKAIEEPGGRVDILLLTSHGPSSAIWRTNRADCLLTGPSLVRNAF